MDESDALEAIWSGHRQGLHHPEQLQGRLTMGEAYRVQLGLLDRYVASGDRHVGWKVGLTSRAMQEQQGLREPVFGFLLESGHRQTGAVFEFADLIRPAFENELCIAIGRTLKGPNVTLAQAGESIDSIAPALEVVERRGDAAGDLPLALADNAQQRAFVTGPARAPGGVDLAAVTADVFVNGAHQEQASGAAVLGTPVASIVWLANKLSEFDRGLDAGMLVMSGSFTRQHAIGSGDRVEARFDQVGVVSAEFR